MGHPESLYRRRNPGLRIETWGTSFCADDEMWATRHPALCYRDSLQYVRNYMMSRISGDR